MLRNHLSEEVLDLAAFAREVAERKIGPLVEKVERDQTFSPAIRDVLAEAGFLGLIVPERFGGSDTNLFDELVVVEEIARVYPSAATYLTAHWVSSKLLVRAADGGQSDDWLLDALQKIAAGEWLGALGATEPEAGSDLASVKTRSELDGDTWVTNGAKRFITNGGFSDFIALVVRTGEAGSKGISILFAESDAPGVSAIRYEHKMGLHGSATAELAIDNLRVPADHILGEVNDGWRMVMDGLDAGRVVVAAMALGQASSALDHSVRYSRDRRQFGQSISEFQGVQFLLADMEIAVATSRSIVYDAASAIVEGRPNGSHLASIAKTHATDSAMQVTSDAVQVHGGYGYVTDFPVEMLMRDAKIHQIYEGTNQLQRSLIARHLLRDGPR
ncbi:MAG: acyl-CoA dehydrogenase family protein [Cryobacterium sp.]|nr:acyl-CoA dehydrogenase family protein [Cryobacterium sp.]